MKRSVIVDTGPLVAFLSERDTYHEWVQHQMAAIAYPLFTCEAVISETCFLRGANMLTKYILFLK